MSCEIENLVTAQGNLYRADSFPDSMLDPAAKQIACPRSAVKRGIDRLQRSGHRLTHDLLIDIFGVVKSRADGFQVEPGPVIAKGLYCARASPGKMAECKQTMRDRLPRIYSHELLNNLLRHPYTRINAVCRDLQVSRPTAARYLSAGQRGTVPKRRVGRIAFYVNTSLVDLMRGSD